MPNRYPEYKKYIQSQDWQKKRKDYYKKYNIKVCQACRKTDCILHLHHRTYTRVGSEHKKDLIHLCSDCHNELHCTARKIGITMNNQRSYDKKHTLWSLTKVFVKQKTKKGGKNKKKWLSIINS